MASQERGSADTGARPRRGAGAQGFRQKPKRAARGSISLVLLVAVALVAAAGGLIYVGRDYAEAYVLTLLAALGTIGVFALFAIASGILRFAGKDQGNPLLKAVVDRRLRRHSGHRPRRPRLLCQRHLSRSDRRRRHDNDVRPIERVFIGDPDVSESIYRLLKAAREGRRLQEEVRIAGAPGESGRWLRMRVRPLGESKRDARMTVWSIADVTRDRERQENVFQELQHAIDYLDHAPAGLLLGRCRRRHCLSQCHAGGLARSRSRASRRRLAQAQRYRRRRRRGASHDA